MVVHKREEEPLVLLPCHGVHGDEPGQFHGEHPEDRPIYDAHLAYAINHMAWLKGQKLKPLLVISGGRTKPERPCSESLSYLLRAPQIGLSAPPDVALEEHSLTSVDNLLLGLYQFHKVRGGFPSCVQAISWEFKRQRFEKALDAINGWDDLDGCWPNLDFYPVGDLSGGLKDKVLGDEAKDWEALSSGIEAYYESDRVRELIAKRDVYKSRDELRIAYAGFPLPF